MEHTTEQNLRSRIIRSPYTTTYKLDMNSTTNNTDATSEMPQWLQAFCTSSKWDLKQLSHLSLTGATLF